MSESHEVLRTLAMVLLVAGVTTLLFHRLKQPVVFGYLLAGMIVGPHIHIPLVADEGMVQTMAELGVILLMFGLGLEFSFRRLLAVGATAGVVAVLQTTTMVALGFLAGQAFGWTTLESIYAGAVIAISSTTIIVKAFAEQKAAGRFVQVAFGVLIIEDLIAIFLLAVLTAVSGGDAPSAADLGRTALKLVVFLAALIVIGLLVVPRLTRVIVRLNRPEITVITAVGLAFGAGYLALSFGYSVALGSFLAGSLVAESGEEKTVEHLVQPVRDMFAAIFFVAVGMLIDPRVILQHWDAVLIFTALVITGKVVAVSIGAFLAGYGTRTSVQTGMSLAQIGEFSFIIAGVGLSTGATRAFLYPVAVAVSAITTLTTPWLIRAAGPAASFVDRHLPRPLQNFVALYGAWMEQARSRPSQPRSGFRGLVGLLLLDALVLALVILAGWQFSRSGITRLVTGFDLSPRVARWIVLGAIAGIASPFVFGLFRLTRAIGQRLALRALPAAEPGKVDLGNAPRRAFLVAWQLAGVFLISVPLLAITRAVVPVHVSIALVGLLIVGLGIAFWKSATNLQGHTRAGAEVIVAALGRQLAPLPAPPEGPGISATTERAAATLAPIYSMIPGLGEPVPHPVRPGDYADGLTLGQIDLRDVTDATVLVIVRDGKATVLPEGKERLQAGDVLALAGSRNAVGMAMRVLTKGPDGG